MKYVFLMAIALTTTLLFGCRTSAPENSETLATSQLGDHGYVSAGFYVINSKNMIEGEVRTSNETLPFDNPALTFANAGDDYFITTLEREAGDKYDSLPSFAFLKISLPDALEIAGLWSSTSLKQPPSISCDTSLLKVDIPLRLSESSTDSQDLLKGCTDKDGFYSFPVSLEGVKSNKINVFLTNHSKPAAIFALALGSNRVIDFEAKDEPSDGEADAFAAFSEQVRKGAFLYDDRNGYARPYAESGNYQSDYDRRNRQEQGQGYWAEGGYNGVTGTGTCYVIGDASYCNGNSSGQGSYGGGYNGNYKGLLT